MSQPTKSRWTTPRERLARARITQQMLVEQTGLCQAAICRLLSGARRAADLQSAVLDAFVQLGGPDMAVDKFWGPWFGRDGRRKRSGGCDGADANASRDAS